MFKLAVEDANKEAVLKNSPIRLSTKLEGKRTQSISCKHDIY